MKKKQFRFILGIITLFACIMIALSSVIQNSVFAKYTSKTDGELNGQVAEFSVSATPASGVSSSLRLSNSKPTASYSFTVKSDSKVAVTYDVIVKTMQKLPDYVAVSVDEQTIIADSTGLTYTLTGVGSFPENGGTKTHALTFTLTAQLGEEAITIENMSLSVRFTQSV